uniref:Uncharacterized protein n=1 Tax=Panagrolaimus sp. PS1159 TaxID=55785 RepID=A0AC35GNR9_9BILA
MKANFIVVVTTFILFCIFSAIVVADDDGGCWRPTYGRGVGKPISSCEDGQDQDAGLCYSQCDDGYYGVGPVCWHSCPSGFTDYGVGCSKPSSYWRGTGHFTQSACEESEGTRCEKYLLLWYPICSNGYYNAGCCICSSYCPEGLVDTGASCTKTSYGRGVGTPLGCAHDLVYDAGLCYPECQGNYNGVGPVCWDACPSGKFGCGALCLDSEAECVIEMLSIAQEVGLAVAEIASDPFDAPAVLAETIIKLAPDLIKPLCSES